VGFWATDVTASAVALHWTGTAWKQQTTPGTSNLFRAAVLPKSQLFTPDLGTIFLGQSGRGQLSGAG